jgi:spore germination cell wall hydrolase CwlJ-like protein
MNRILALVLISIALLAPEAHGEEHTGASQGLYVSVEQEYALEKKLLREEMRAYSEIPLTDYEIEILSKLIHLEARGEPEEGQIEVAKVVLNRVNDARFPDTIEEVIFQKRQFTPAAKIKCLTLDIEPYKMIIARAFESESESLYFMNRGLSDSGNIGWFDTLVATGTIGNHEFFR